MSLPRPQVEHIEAHKWKLTAPFRLGNTIIPEGFISDGASVPRVFWSVFSPAGKLFEASLLHDYMYKEKIASKEEADVLFYSNIIAYGTNKFLAKIAYLFVKYGGKGNY